jgi:hypothetical protein
VGKPIESTGAWRAVKAATEAELARFRRPGRAKRHSATPLPPGTFRCLGDPGCEFRLPKRGLCPYHADDATVRMTAIGRYQRMMEE